jgi:Putative restriction endonuclease
MLPLHEIPRYTYNDYKQWEGQWELIYGYPCAMSPSATNLYESLGVNYYLLADPYKKQIEYFQLINNKYEQKTTIDCFVLHNNCEITIDLNEIFE